MKLHSIFLCMFYSSHNIWSVNLLLTGGSTVQSCGTLFLVPIPMPFLQNGTRPDPDPVKKSFGIPIPVKPVPISIPRYGNDDTYVIQTDRKPLVTVSYFCDRRLTTVISFVIVIFQRENRRITSRLTGKMIGEPSANRTISRSTVGFYAEKSR